MCVVLHPETMLLWLQNPLWKKKAVVFITVTVIIYQNQLNAGFSKYVKLTAPSLQ